MQPRSPQSASQSKNTRRWIATSAGVLVLGIAAVKLLVHLYADRRYGYFIDELYYLACSRHLDWGYVDQPPLIAVLTRISRAVLGDSLQAIRLLPALAGATTVLFAGLIAREMRGRRFAQVLAALSVLVAPGFLGIDSFLSMNAYEGLIWTACAYVLIRIVNTENQKLWIAFGILAGIGTENKHSMFIFGAGIALGLILTAQRKVFRQRWIWIAGLIAFLIFLPNLIWNIQHHFPFIELQANIRRSGRNVDLNPLQFFAQQILNLLPLTFPIWLAGLWYFFFNEQGKPYRALGWAWLFTAFTIVVLDPRVYYLWPAFPMLFAAGAVMWEHWLTAPQFRWVKVVYTAAMIVVGAVFAPLAMPLLPVETYIRYAKALHFQQPRIENQQLGPLPQTFADQFGWPEMVATIARVYDALPPDVRGKTAIFAQYYGQAGAIDLFGPKYGLPSAISGHQNYFLWGPRDYTGESVIVLDDRQENLEREFSSVQKVAHVYHPYSMPAEHFDVFYCRGLKAPLKDLWPQVKNWD